MTDSGLPEGWEVRISNSKKHPYYFNATTHESRWDPPPGANRDQLEVYMNTRFPNMGLAPPPEKIRCAHLLVKHRDSRRPSSWREQKITRSKEEALEILKKHKETIMSGQTSLRDLAATESDCSSASKRGDLGFFAKGDMQKEFEVAAFALQPGDISDVVDSASGLHLIQRIA